MYSKKAKKIDRNLKLRFDIYYITSNLESRFCQYFGLLKEHELYKVKDAIEFESYYSFNNRWPNDDHEVGLG